MATEAYLREPGGVGLTCILTWLVAFGLCGAGFWMTHREAARRLSGLRWCAILALQAASMIFMVVWWRSLLGGFLLVFTAWQADQ